MFKCGGIDETIFDDDFWLNLNGFRHINLHLFP